MLGQYPYRARKSYPFNPCATNMRTIGNPLPDVLAQSLLPAGSHIHPLTWDINQFIKLAWKNKGVFLSSRRLPSLGHKIIII